MCRKLKKKKQQKQVLLVSVVSASPGVLEQISYVQSWATVPLTQYKKRVPISVKYGQKQMANVLWNLPKISFEVLLPYNFSKVWIKNKKLYFFFFCE